MSKALLQNKTPLLVMTLAVFTFIATVFTQPECAKVSGVQDTANTPSGSATNCLKFSNGALVLTTSDGLAISYVSPAMAVVNSPVFGAADSGRFKPTASLSDHTLALARSVSKDSPSA